MSIADTLTYAHCCALLLLSVSSICSMRLIWSVGFSNAHSRLKHGSHGRAVL